MRHGPLVPLILLAVTLPSLAGCFGTEQEEPADVVTSFYPLHFFSARIAGDNLTVQSLVPTGAEPHDWEPRPQDIARLANAKVFVYNGAGFEPWVDRMVREAGNSNLKIVDASAAADPVTFAEEEGHEGETEEEHEAHAHEGGLDPHFWLDPVRSQRVAAAIATAFKEVDPANAATYDARAAALQGDLAALDAAYTQGLANCTKREILTTHAAFTYLADRYNFTVYSVSGVSPEAQPSARKIQEMVEIARDHGIKYVFFETLVNDAVAETIAREVGAETLVLNPVEGLTPSEAEAGKDYFSLMQDNLANLQKAMECL